MKKELLTLEKTFNLTSFFTEIKSSSLWNVLEVKTMLLLFKEISKQAIFLKDKELSEFDKINIKNKYDINLKEWEEITGLTKTSNYYREFKKLRNNLSAKPVTTPHPLKPNCDKSSVSMPLFTKVEYLSGSDHFSLTVHEEHIKNLAIFVKYSKISFKYISKLRSHYSVFSYILIKLLLDSSYSKEFIISLDDFKLKISLGNKYKQINPFKEFVLDVIKKEVNELTQINLDYELIKEGRSFTKIKFTFDYKTDYLEQKDK
jgi:plasmid replication initiation protein